MNRRVSKQLPVTVCWRLIGIVVTLDVMSATQAFAQDLPAALELEAEGRLTEALDAYDHVLTRPGNSRDDLSTIYLHLAVLRFGVGDEVNARHALHRLFALAGGVELPASAPPELLAMAEEVAHVWGDRRFTASVEAPSDVGPDEAASVRLSVVDDVAGFVASGVLLSDGEEIVRSGGRGPTFVLDVPASLIGVSGIEVTPQLRNENEGVVWEGESIVIDRVEASSAEASGGEGGGSTRSQRLMRILGWTFLGTGLATGAVGGAMVGIDGRVIETRQQDGLLEERRYTTAIAGWILVGLGASALVTSAILIIYGYREREALSIAGQIAQGQILRW